MDDTLRPTLSALATAAAAEATAAATEAAATQARAVLADALSGSTIEGIMEQTRLAATEVQRAQQQVTTTASACKEAGDRFVEACVFDGAAVPAFSCMGHGW